MKRTQIIGFESKCWSRSQISYMDWSWGSKNGSMSRSGSMSRTWSRSWHGLSYMSRTWLRINL